MRFAIEAQGLKKKFGETQAVNDVDIMVEEGEVFALLGPNGAGKTTTVRMLATLLKPDEGSGSIAGRDLIKSPAKVREVVSLTGQFASLDEDLTGHENLVLVARLLGFSWREAKSKAEQLLSAFGLQAAGKRQVLSYSGGMRRKLDIAASLIRVPKVLFLDEPTTGLDPRSRNQVWDIVKEITSLGTTVLLTTQYLEEADQLAGRLAVIDNGKVIAAGTGRELKARVGGSALRLTFNDADSLQRAIALLKTEGALDLVEAKKGAGCTVQVHDHSQAMALLQKLDAQGLAVPEFSLGSPTLDEVFFALTGKQEAGK